MADGRRRSCRCGWYRFTRVELCILVQEVFSLTGVGVRGFCIVDGNGKGGGAYHAESYTGSQLYDRPFLSIIMPGRRSINDI